MTLGAQQQGMVAGRRRQHGIPGAVRGRAGPGLGRRDDAAAEPRERSPTPMPASHQLKGKVEPGPPLERPRRRRRPWRRTARRRPRGAPRRARARAAAGQGAVPRRRDVAPAGAAARRRRARRRQDPAGLGVREVRRRPRHLGPLAHRDGAWPTGRASPSGPSPRRCGAACRGRERTPTPSRASCWTIVFAQVRASPADERRVDATSARGAPRHRPRTGSPRRTCSRPGRPSSSAWAKERTRSCSSSTTRSTPRTGCSSSSSTS